MRRGGAHPLRILQVPNGYPHRAYGGVELHTYELCRALSERGHALSVFTRVSEPSRQDGETIDEEVEGVPVRSVVNDFKRGRFVDHWRSEAVGRVFERTLDEWRPEVVHFQHLIGLSCDLPAIARRRGLRVVATVHEYWYACQRVMLQHADGSPCGGPATADCEACVLGDEPRPPRPGWRERAAAALRGALRGVPAVGSPASRERFAALSAALGCYERTLTPSRFVIEEMARLGMPLRRARAVPLGIDVAAFPPPSAPAPLPVTAERPLRVAFVGQLLPHKGPHVLLEALARLPGLPIRLDLHGRRWPDHAYEARLGPLLAAEPRARVHGRFAEGALPGLLAEADVVAVPSTCAESYGIATRQAHLAARPVLSADRGALPESLNDGEDGLLLPAGDAAAWAAALSRLATDADLLERLCAGARRARDRVPSMADYAARVEAELYRA